MKVLFAVNNEKISEAIIKKYQAMYKEIISWKNVYFFNAIIKELQKNINIDSDKKIITNLSKLICLNINNYKSQIFKYDIEIECGELKSMLRKYL